MESKNTHQVEGEQDLFLKELHEEAERLTQEEINEKTAQILKAKEEKKEKEKEMKKLQRELQIQRADLEDLKKKDIPLNEEMKIKEALMEKLQAEEKMIREEISKHDDLIKELEREKAKIEAELAQKEVAMVALMEKLEDCKRRMEANQAEIASHEREVAILQKELERLKIQHAQYDNEIQKFKETIRQLEEKLKMHEEQVAQLQSEIEELQKDFMRMEKEMEALRNQEAGFKEKIQLLEEKKLQLASVMAEIQQLIATYKEEENEKKKQISELSSRLNDLDKDQEKKRADYENENRLLDKLKQVRLELEQKRNELENKMIDLERNREVLQEEVAAIVAEVKISKEKGQEIQNMIVENKKQEKELLEQKIEKENALAKETDKLKETQENTRKTNSLLEKIKYEIMHFIEGSEVLVRDMNAAESQIEQTNQHKNEIEKAIKNSEETLKKHNESLMKAGFDENERKAELDKKIAEERRLEEEEVKADSALSIAIAGLDTAAKIPAPLNIPALAIAGSNLIKAIVQRAKIFALHTKATILKKACEFKFNCIQKAKDTLKNLLRAETDKQNNIKQMLSPLKEKIAYLTQRIKDLGGANKEKQSQINASKDRESKCQSELGKFQTILSATNSVVNELSANRNTINQKLGQVGCYLTQLNSDLHSHQEATKACEKKLSEIDNHKKSMIDKERSQIQSKLEEIDERRQDIKAKIDAKAKIRDDRYYELQNAERLCKQTRESLENLALDKEGLQRKLKEKHTELQSAEKALEEVKAMQVTKKQEAENLQTTIREQKRATEKDFKELAKKKGEIQRCEAEIIRMESKTSSVQESLRDVEAKCAAKEVEISGRVTATKLLMKNLEELNKTKEKFEQEVSRVDSEKKELLKAQDSIDKDIKKEWDQLKKQETKWAKHMEKMVATQNELRAIEEKKVKSEEEINKKLFDIECKEGLVKRLKIEQHEKINEIAFSIQAKSVLQQKQQTRLQEKNNKQQLENEDEEGHVIDKQNTKVNENGYYRYNP